MEQARPRGRPRSYDPELALQRARDTFWHSGYAGTSLDDLAAAMGMNRPSIYAGFGDKRALYVAAAQRYAADSRAALVAQLAQPRPLRPVLREFYRNAKKFYLAGDDGPRGCFLVGTAVTEAKCDELVREIVDTTFAGFTELFAERFERAAAEGELPTTTPPRALAEVATAALINIAVCARAGAKGTRINAIIEATLTVLFAGQPVAAV